MACRPLHRLGFAWRRPRPVVGPVDPDHTFKLLAIQELLRTLPPDEVAVFQDEVDIHLNPKIGAARMPRGRQAEVVTPGNNQKRHLAGSLVSRPERWWSVRRGRGGTRRCRRSHGCAWPGGTGSARCQSGAWKYPFG
jgi:hypothetical protein